ncbi:MAG: hypothetical protein ACYC3X_09240 [Pirellulaceae bacterium]
MKALLWIVVSIACCVAPPSGFVAAEDLAIAIESFPYRGTYPLELEFLGPAGAGWKSSWQRWGDLPPVFVDSHTINNPFGSEHGSTERASNHSGQLRASQRQLCDVLGENGSRASIEFAMMEYTAANQDGIGGGLQLLKEGRPVVFCGRALHASHFAVGPSYDVSEASLRQTELKTALPGELYRTHYFRLVIEYGETSDRARLES